MRDIVTELRDQGPTRAEVARAQAYAAGARTIAFENTGAVARFAAQQTIVYGEPVDPDATIKLLDQVTYDDVREVAAGVADELSVAVVGPAYRHRAGDGLRRWVAAGAVVVVAVAITLALLGSLSHTSKRDVAFDAGAPVVPSRPGHSSGSRRP